MDSMDSRFSSYKLPGNPELRLVPWRLPIMDEMIQDHYFESWMILLSFHRARGKSLSAIRRTLQSGRWWVSWVMRNHHQPRLKTLFLSYKGELNEVVLGNAWHWYPRKQLFQQKPFATWLLPNVVANVKALHLSATIYLIESSISERNFIRFPRSKRMSMLGTWFFLPLTFDSLS